MAGRTVRAWSLVSLLIVVWLPSRAAGADVEAVAEIAADRDHIAADFAQQIAACVVAHDTDHPAFHGCIDWHSAVHGLWALVAFSRATGDQRYRPLIDSLLRPDLVGAERAYLAGHPEFEMPYGRAWFLRLAADYRSAFGSELLAAMARDVADSLVARYRTRRADPNAGAYDSDSWALLNLLHYARAAHDDALAGFVAGIVRRDFVPVTAPCDPAAEDGEFMAVCTNRAWLVSQVLTSAELPAWLAGFLRPGDLHPVVSPRSAHESGLNFSRAWGLWALYAATGDRQYGALYAAHFLQSYRHREAWAGGYRTVGHWVAQFGMLALLPMFDRASP